MSRSFAILDHERVLMLLLFNIDTEVASEDAGEATRPTSHKDNTCFYDHMGTFASRITWI